MPIHQTVNNQKIFTVFDSILSLLASTVTTAISTSLLTTELYNAYANSQCRSSWRTRNLKSQWNTVWGNYNRSKRPELSIFWWRL